MAREGKRLVQVYLDEGLAASLIALAERHGRTLTDEIAAAARRHLAAPPVYREPALRVETVDGKEKKGRGRPLKETAGE